MKTSSATNNRNTNMITGTMTQARQNSAARRAVRASAVSSASRKARFNWFV
ncbi:MAG: hypothetical protein FWH27_15095 [Planctomycetaceae bacterium]|nr:hypothetical protein [Planctomycetaceae bacterium]